ncbi:MAG TPA: hypothetical protein DCR97_14925 [Deltaproteobacteria bacterium]|nr:hypothetical protein [Deltaproteobacteria bacterium]
MYRFVAVLIPVTNLFRRENHHFPLQARHFLTRVLTCLVFLSLFPGNLWGASNTPLEARLVSATLKVFSDFPISPGSAQPFRMTVVRNEYAPFQVAVRAKEPLEEVAVMMECPVSETAIISHSANRTFLVEAVPIEKPSIPPKPEGADLGFPRFWPDPLPPFETFQLEDAARTRAVWFDLFIPADTRPGLYKGNIVVSAKRIAPVRLPFQLEVHDITIPTAPSLRTAFGNASLRACLEKRQAAPRGSTQLNKLVEEYYWFLVDHRLSPYHIPVDIFTDEAHKFLDDPRVTSFVVPISGGIGTKGEIWDDAKMKSLSDRLERTGWINKGFLYLIDEPSPEAIPDVIRIGERIHAINPRLKYLMTTHSRHLLSDKRVVEQAEIDIWAPILSIMSAPAERRILLKEQERGKELWWYTCVAPKWPGINYFIDEAANGPRIHPWMNHLYGNDGILYWATDNWSQVGCNPWERTETYPTGNGDGSLLYPSRDGFNRPVASIRLKMLREGLEDQELLRLLGMRLKEVASRIGGRAADYRPRNRLFEHAFALVTEEGRSQGGAEEAQYLKYLTRDHHDIEKQRDLVIHEIEDATNQPLLVFDTVPCDKGYTSSSSATVTGYAETGSLITVNGAEAPLTQNRFEVAVAIAPGANTITVNARGQAGRTKTIKRTINRR